jgi:hypothetical protein
MTILKTLAIAFTASASMFGSVAHAQASCIDLSGSWLGEGIAQGELIVLNQAQCSVSGTLDTGAFYHTFRGTSDATSADITIERRHVASGCVTNVFTRFELLGSQRISRTIRGTDGKCELPTNFSNTAAYNRTGNVGNTIVSAPSKLDERCLISWDDSHQVHSVSGFRVKMKKLRHCVKLRTFGPLDAGAVAKEYVRHCVNQGLNSQKTQYMVKAIAAIGADVLGAGGGASAAVIADYVASVADGTLKCLTSAQEFNTQIGETLRARFNATVTKESHWIYWKV